MILKDLNAKTPLQRPFAVAIIIKSPSKVAIASTSRRSTNLRQKCDRPGDEVSPQHSTAQINNLYQKCDRPLGIGERSPQHLKLPKSTILYQKCDRLLYW